ncbi:hypothetical protein AB4254_11100 [Vibrio breoganii]
MRLFILSWLNFLPTFSASDIIEGKATTSRATISSAFAPFFVVTGLTNESELTEGLTEREKLNQIAGAFKLHIDLNLDHFTALNLLRTH